MGDLCAQHSPLLSELLVKHEDGMVIETTVPGIYHVDAAIFLERVEDGRNDNLPAQIDFPPLFPALPATAYVPGATEQPEIKIWSRECSHLRPRSVHERLPRSWVLSCQPSLSIPAPYGSAFFESHTSTDLTHRPPLNPDCRKYSTTSTVSTGPARELLLGGPCSS